MLGQVIGKNLSRHLQNRIWPSFMSTLPKTQLEDIQSSHNGKLSFIPSNHL